MLNTEASGRKGTKAALGFWTISAENCPCLLCAVLSASLHSGSGEGLICPRVVCESVGCRGLPGAAGRAPSFHVLPGLSAGEGGGPEGNQGCLSKKGGELLFTTARQILASLLLRRFLSNLNTAACWQQHQRSLGPQKEMPLLKVGRSVGRGAPVQSTGTSGCQHSPESPRRE